MKKKSMVKGKGKMTMKMAHETAAMEKKEAKLLKAATKKGKK